MSRENFNIAVTAFPRSERDRGTWHNRHPGHMAAASSLGGWSIQSQRRSHGSDGRYPRT
jgi:hypothetical protein